LHLHCKRREVAYYPEGKTDDTLLSTKGAQEISKIEASELKKLDLDLKNFIKY
jgi:hypothetical protein